MSFFMNRSFIVRLFFQFALIGPAPIVWAAPLTLKDSIRKGLSGSFEVQRAEASRRQADSDYSLVEAKLFPTIEAKGTVGSTKYSNSRSSSSLSGNVESYKALLTFSQPLYAGGTTFAGLSAAKLSLKKAQQELFSAKQDYILEIVKSYYEMAENKVLLDLALEYRDNLKSYAAITARYARIGRSKNIDRLQSESNYHLSEAQVLDAETKYETARQDLARLLSLESDAELEIDPNMKAQPVETGSLNELYQRAVENNPAIAALSYQVDYTRKANRVKMGSHFPQLTLDGNWGYDSRDRPSWFDKDSETSSVMLNLTIPLFSGLSGFAQNSYNNDELVKAERDLAIAKRDLRKDLSESVATMSKQFERIKLTKTSAESARKAMLVAIRDYRNGLLSSTDVLNIQRTGYDADKTHTEAQYSYLTGVLNLRYNLGTDLERVYAMP